MGKSCVGRRSMYAPYDTRTTRNIWMRFVLFWTGCSRHAVSLIRVTKDCRIFRLSNAIMELPIAVQHWHLNETSQYPIDRTLDNSDIYIYSISRILRQYVKHDHILQLILLPRLIQKKRETEEEINFKSGWKFHKVFSCSTYPLSQLNLKQRLQFSSDS